MEPLFLLIIFIVNFFATSLSVVSGGAGLISVPTILLLGFNPVFAVASYRVGTLGALLTSTIKFHTHNKIDYSLGLKLLWFALLGAIIGTMIVLNLNAAVLEKLIAIFVILVLILILFNPKLGVSKKVKVTAFRQFLGAVFSFVISLVNITIGGSGGTFFSYLFVLNYGKTFLESSGLRKIVNGAPILLASLIFIYVGVVDFWLAGTIFVSGMLSGWFSSEYFLRKGDETIRYFFIALVIFIAVIVLFR